DYFVRVLPGQRAIDGPLSADDLVIIMVISWVSSVINAVIVKRNRSFIQMAENESAKSLERLAAIEKAVEASSESLNLGSQLVESSKSTAMLVDQMSMAIANAEKKMEILDSRARSLSDSIKEIATGSGNLRKASDDQSSVISETSAAIEEMTASLENI